MRVIDTGNLHRYVQIGFFSNYWFIYYFRVSSWKMIYLFCSQSLTESYFLWDFVLANEVCHFWSASQQNLVCTGNLKGEWNYWIKVDKIKRSITIQDQSQKFWIICVLSTQSRSHFLKFSFLFFLFGNANQIFGIKRIRKPKRAVSSTSTAAMPPVLVCVLERRGNITLHAAACMHFNPIFYCSFDVFPFY